MTFDERELSMGQVHGRVRRGALLGLLALTLAALTATTADARPAAARADSITLYSGQHEQTTAALVKDFTRRTGIAVKVRSADEASLANEIIQEGSSSPADVFYAENPPALTVLDEHHLLAPVAKATLSHVAARYSSPAGHWVGVSARSAVLAYNTDDLKTSQLPRSLAALADPAWKGKIGFSPEETDFQPLITAMAKLHGKAAAVTWLEGLEKNAKYYDDNETLIAAVNSGQIAAGLVDHYYWYRLRDEVGRSKVHSALHYFGPGDAGALVDVSGAAVLVSSGKATLAQQFLAYLVSAPAQRIIATSESYEYPLGSGVVTHKVLVPFAGLHPPKISPSLLGDGSYALSLLRTTGAL
jgi:iron(III) transport system substrate-binding protein